jgi:hypothetical protein
MASFELNFNSPEKTVTISLEDQNGIFQLAELFKKLLDEAGIENTLTEKFAEPVQSVESVEEPSN